MSTYRRMKARQIPVVNRKRRTEKKVAGDNVFKRMWRTIFGGSGERKTSGHKATIVDRRRPASVRHRPANRRSEVKRKRSG